MEYLTTAPGKSTPAPKSSGRVLDRHWSRMLQHYVDQGSIAKIRVTLRKLDIDSTGTKPEVVARAKDLLSNEFT